MDIEPYNEEEDPEFPIYNNFYEEAKNELLNKHDSDNNILQEMKENLE